MRIPVLPVLLPVLLPALVLLPGCGAAVSTSAVTISAGPSSPGPVSVGSGTRVSSDLVPVLWAVEDVFERVGIPVASVDEGGREVRSGEFTVRQTWDGDRVERRLECAALGDLDPSTLYDAPFLVSVVARVRDAGASSEHLTITGQAVRQGETPQAIGRTHCRLREPFRQWLLEEVRRKALNLPMRPRTY